MREIASFCLLFFSSQWGSANRHFLDKTQIEIFLVSAYDLVKELATNSNN